MGSWTVTPPERRYLEAVIRLTHANNCPPCRADVRRELGQTYRGGGGESRTIISLLKQGLLRQPYPRGPLVPTASALRGSQSDDARGAVAGGRSP